MYISIIVLVISISAYFLSNKCQKFRADVEIHSISFACEWGLNEQNLNIFNIYTGYIIKTLMSSYRLFGIFAIHSPESCPLNNSESKDVFKEIYNKMQSNSDKYGISEIAGFYMSVLEHEWIILVKSNSAHDIEQLCIESGISTFNTVKIVPLTNYQDVLERIQ